MKICEFVEKNVDQISYLIDNHLDEKMFGVDTKDFDFTNPDITLDIEDDEDLETTSITFLLEIKDITLTCTVDSSNLKESLPDLKMIKDPEMREQLVVAIEENILPSVGAGIENAETAVQQAKNEHQSFLDEEENTKNSLREIKDEWGII